MTVPNGHRRIHHLLAVRHASTLTISGVRGASVVVSAITPGRGRLTLSGWVGPFGATEWGLADMASGNWETKRFEEVAVGRSRRRFEVGQDSASRLDHQIFLGLSERRNRDNFANDLRAIVRIGEDFGQRGVIGRGEDGVDEGSGSARLGCLGNDCILASAVQLVAK